MASVALLAVDPADSRSSFTRKVGQTHRFGGPPSMATRRKTVQTPPSCTTSPNRAIVSLKPSRVSGCLRSMKRGSNRPTRVDHLISGGVPLRQRVRASYPPANHQTTVRYSCFSKTVSVVDESFRAVRHAAYGGLARSL